MKIFEINNKNVLAPLMMLNEANVLNIKLPYEGHSLVEYLKSFADHLASQETKNIFTKKLQKLLINDERFLYAVRVLPPDAPVWAQQAHDAGELFYFKPSEDLDQTVEHLMHYLAAIEQDIKNPPLPDVKVHAQRELQGFTKAENLDVLAKKSQEYFKRGSKRAKKLGDEGTKMILDAGGGFKWHLLLTQEAYRRTGKVLQNCIGQIYTRNGTKQNGEEIIVLRKANGEEVVAARIGNKNHEIREMKGKNNKPPVERYMPPVKALLDKLKLKVSSTAQWDFERAGYFYIQGNLYTRSEAAQKFINTTPIDDVAINFAGRMAKYKLVRVSATLDDDTSSRSVVQSLLGNIYHAFKYHFKTGRPDIYEFRDKNNKPLISALVHNNELQQFQRWPGAGEVTEAAGATDAASELRARGGLGFQLARELSTRGLISGVGHDLAKDLLWNDSVNYNTKTGEMDPIEPEEVVQTDNKRLSWERHTNDNVTRQFQSALDDNRWSARTRGGIEPKDIDEVYLTKVTGSKALSVDDQTKEIEMPFVLMKLKNGTIIPAIVNPNGGLYTPSTSRTMRSGPPNPFGGLNINSSLITSAMELANKTKGNLPKSFRFNYGLVKDGDTYKRYQPKAEKLAGDPPAVMYDLREIDLDDRLAAINRITMGIKTRKRILLRPIPADADPESVRAYDDMELGNRILGALAGEKYRATQYPRARELDDNVDWDSASTKKIYELAFRGTVPDRFFVVDVSYGTKKTHQVAMLADGKKIVVIDHTTAAQDFQKWDDFDKVADQLNKFAKQHGLRYDDRALVKRAELRIHRGEVRSASFIQYEKIGRMKQRGRIGLEGTDQLKYADGATLTRLTPEEQAVWTRKGIGKDSVPGEAWRLNDAAGAPAAMFIVKDNVVQQMYLKGVKTWRERHENKKVPDQLLLRDRKVDKQAAQYLNGAREQFDWGVKNIAQFMVRPESKQHRILRALNDRPGARTNVLARAGIAPGSAAGWDRPGAADRHLYELGLINKERRGRRIDLSISEDGKDVLAQLEQGNEVNSVQFAGRARMPKDWVKPTRRAPPPKKKTKHKVSTSAPRAGTKASLALAKFTEMTDANGRQPTRGEFIAVLTRAPFNMSKTGAQTYYYTTKAKYGKQQGTITNEEYAMLLAQAARLRGNGTTFGALRSLLIG